jgi:pseudoazurin
MPMSRGRSPAVRRRIFLTGALSAPLLALARPLWAGEHVVRMRNKGAAGAFVFEPAVLRIAPGDTVWFVPDSPGHNSESVGGMTPAGAVGWKGELSRGVAVTLTVPGVYGYRCRPHYAMGMVGLIVVGDARVSLAEVKAIKHKGKAGKMFEALLAELA